MNKSTKKLIDILIKDEPPYNKKSIEIIKVDNGFRITTGQIYNSISINLSKLMELVEFFGTKDIDIDQYSRKGCPTCDFGSEYGHTIDIKNPTKNLDIEDTLEEIEANYSKVK